ncbi:MAG: hypothetical protein HQM08_16840 [Candidatus Riflebacteria bacterium]|nr:hypothetical protein [Candidatus Riflebacteria bacterium]
MRFSVLLGLFLTFSTASFAGSAPILLSQGGTEISIVPSSLEIWYKGPKGSSRLISSGIDADVDSDVTVELNGSTKAIINQAKRGNKILVTFDGSELDFEIERQKPGKLNWPSIPLTETSFLIWPFRDGRYIPVTDSGWMKDFAEGDAHELGSGLPLWGWTNGSGTVAWVTETPYRNSIAMDKISFGLKQNFLCRKGAELHRLSVKISDRIEPLLPAFLLRDRLQKAGLFRTMKDKFADLPAGSKDRLLGALHAYLWGNKKISVHDIKSFSALARKISDNSEFSQHVLALMDKESKDSVAAFTKDEYAGAYAKTCIVRGLDAVLSKITAEELYSKYSDFLQSPQNWGEGCSPGCINELKALGIDRARLTLPGIGTGPIYLATAKFASDSGFLFGIYDSYNGIHPKSIWGTDESWETSQFTQELFETGSIMKSDGSYYKGYHGKGRMLSPIAAQPFFIQRVNKNLAQAPLSFYFIDCDAAGEIYEDYNPLHPSTSEEAAEARRNRLCWLAKEKGLIVGSEGGDALIAPSILVSEGLFGPVFSWEEPDYKKKTSPFFQGSYWPPEAPDIQFKPMPLKPSSIRRYFDPATRLPLFEAAFHDSLVITNHWGADPLKFSDMERRSELFQMLYLTAPLYNLNRDRIAKNAEGILANYKFYSPLHRKFGDSRLLAFDCFDENRLIQRTRFEGGLELIANFSEKEFSFEGLNISPAELIAKLPDGKILEYKKK